MTFSPELGSGNRWQKDHAALRRQFLQRVTRLT